jgi:hypothetical protein
MIGRSSIYNISSYNRMNESDESSSFQFKAENYKADNDYDSIALLGCSIPKSYYLIDSRHNSFTLQEGASSFPVEITPGNYNYLNLSEEIQTALNNAGSFTYTCTASDGIGKFVFGVSGNSGVQPVMACSDRVLREILGFNETNTFVSSAYTCPYVMTLQRCASILISCSWVAGGDRNILQDVYAIGDDFSNVVFTQQSIEFNSRPLQNSQDTTCDIKLLDFRTGETLLMNGGEIVLSLIMYKRNTFYETQMARWILDDAIELFKQQQEVPIQNSLQTLVDNGEIPSLPDEQDKSSRILRPSS